MSERNEPFGLRDWIEEHADDFAPPVSNRVVWPGGDFIFMVVRGPNARSDFHIDPGDEIFYQLEGHIRVDIIDDEGVRHERRVREGDVMLVPGGTPHAPLRPAGSWGVVIERPRRADELDQLVWFCDECGNELHRISFRLDDIETELARAIDQVNRDEGLRTCARCATVAPVPGPFTLPDG